MAKIGYWEPGPGFVWQVGEQDIPAGIAEVEGDTVDTRPQVVPPGPGLHLDTDEARATQ